MLDSMMKNASKMCIAAACNDIKTLNIFLESNISINCADYDGRTPLHVAASKGLK